MKALDGVEKMSKSKNNYVGITEAPEVMFRKLMSISDELMWRYWELLTDKSLAEIAAMKSQHPREVKINLAKTIVADFHSAAHGEHAASEWLRVVSGGEVPADLQTVEADGAMRIDKALVKNDLASSGTDAQRRVKEGAVEVDGTRVSEFVTLAAPGEYVLRLGKNWRRLVLNDKVGILRKHIYWKLLEGELALGETPLVAAVIPIAPEAAPDGEKYLDADRAYARALQMEEAGAAFVELAPETLRPGQAGDR